jgi:hypothetical protein
MSEYETCIELAHKCESARTTMDEMITINNRYWSRQSESDLCEAGNAYFKLREEVGFLFRKLTKDEKRRFLSEVNLR